MALCPVDDEDLLTHTLNGLPSEYGPFKTSIRTQSSGISLEELHVLLLREEMSIETSQCSVLDHSATFISSTDIDSGSAVTGKSGYGTTSNCGSRKSGNRSARHGRGGRGGRNNRASLAKCSSTLPSRLEMKIEALKVSHDMKASLAKCSDTLPSRLEMKLEALKVRSKWIPLSQTASYGKFLYCI
ncbi:hypothetical protein MRB53_031308 [Persea americana]|uniref:Uncharacterized protein n=1 Tax=Persea americana TaxID=3435 RepID=A0ACC2KNN5_PERAE|nr:hypothetical protein MRB53_031308 [Persea americana]